MEIDVKNLFLNFFMTFIVYEILPLTLKYMLNKQYTGKEAKKIAIINSIVGYVLFSVWYIIIGTEQIANVSASFFWGFISYAILRPPKKTVELEHKEEVKKENVEPFSKRFVIMLLIIVIFFSGIIDFFVYLYFKDRCNELQTENINLINQNNGNLNRINELESKNKEYKEKSIENSNKITSMENKVTFMDKHVVIVPANTNIFHKYDCQYLDISNGGLVYNPENARSEGFVPCPKCIK